MNKLSQEQIHILEQDVPQWATKASNKANMTSINPTWVIQTLNEAFGYGGWILEHEFMWDKETGKTDKNATKYSMAVVRGQLRLNLNTENEFLTPMTYGGNDNVDCGDRCKGAVTDLLTKSVQFLNVAHKVFKGEYDGATLKIDKAEQAIKEALSEVKEQFPEDIKNWFLMQWTNSPDKMIAICNDNELKPVSKHEMENYQKWVAANSVKCPDKLVLIYKGAQNG